MHFSTLLAVTAAAAVEAANQGFNYGATNSDGSIKQQQDFLNEFNRAKNLPGTSGFTSARLYTMVQGGTANTVSSAIPAAIASNTGLLLGLWASAGQSSFDNEVTALKNAISQYGTSFTNLIEGISVGSEDLYRNSPTGILNKSGYGAQPQDLVNYIAQVRAAIAGTAAAGKSIGHVDTWTSYVNGSNAAVINAVDWLGVDGYPYFQNTQSNGIENGASLFFESYDAVKAVSGGKDVWITETGWPVSGPTENLAVASAANAEKYWQDVACRVLGNINTYWYTLQDAYPVTPAPSFGIIGTDLNSAPLYDLTCNASTSSSSSSVVASSSTASSSAVSSSTSSSSAVSSSSTLSTSVASPTQPTTAAGTSTVSLATNPGAESTASVPTSVNTFATTVAQSTGTAPVVVTSTAVTSVRGTTSVQNTAPVSGTTSSATPSASVQPSTGGAGSPHTFTSFTTTLVTVTACPGTCSEASVTGSQTGSAPTPSSSNCPANLAGAYEFPHLIVPVDSANPAKAYGTSYNGLVTPSISSLFNFDIPASDAGKTCTLVFLFPQKDQLETSNYQFNGKGGLKITGLSAPATEATTFDSVPAANGQSGSIADVQPGNSYTVLSQPCPAGQRISYEFASVGGLDLDYFQDYNPSPLGVYITVC